VASCLGVGSRSRSEPYQQRETVLMTSVTASTDLSAALEAFIREHEYCGDLDGGVEADRVWMRCTCGAVSNRG